MPLRPDAPAFVPFTTAGAPSPNDGGPQHGPNKEQEKKDPVLRTKSKKKGRRKKNNTIDGQSLAFENASSESPLAREEEQSVNRTQKRRKNRAQKSKNNLPSRSSDSSNINKPHRRQTGEHDKESSNNYTRSKQFQQQRREDRRNKARRGNRITDNQEGRQVQKGQQEISSHLINEEQKPILESQAFPALGEGDIRYSTKNVGAGEQLSQEGGYDTAVWAKIAKPQLPSESHTTNSSQADNDLVSLTSSNMGSKLVLLKKDRPPHRISETVRPTCVVQETPGVAAVGVSQQQEVDERDTSDLMDESRPHDSGDLGYANTGSVPRVEGNGMEESEDENASFNLHRQTIPNLTKLRNRWWNVLQKSAQGKRQSQNRHHYLEEPKAEEKETIHNSKAIPSLSSDVPQCQEYVELHPPIIRNEDQDEGRQQSSLDVDIDELSHYTSCSRPLHKAILNHDEKGLESLLQLYKNDQMNSLIQPTNHISEKFAKWTPLQLATLLDKPGLLRILLRAIATEEDQIRRRARARLVHVSQRLCTLINGDGEQSPTPLMIAAELGHEECAQLLLSHSTTSPATMIACKDKEGNNALHCCCRSTLSNEIVLSKEMTTPSLLRSLLQAVVNAPGTTPSKVLSCKNNLGQTPLHIACQEGRTDMVEVFIDICSGSSLFSVLIKLFSVQDSCGQTPLLAAIASGSTDLVMTMLMWRGNHYHHHLGTQQRQKVSQLSNASPTPKDSSSCCPLLWAVRTSGSADMVRLLLEFHDPSPLSQVGVSGNEEGYDLTHSLHEAVRKSASFRNGKKKEAIDDDMPEIVRVLVEAGANPCCAPSVQPSSTQLSKQTTGVHGTNSICGKTANTSAINFAAKMGHVQTLGALLDSLRFRMLEVKKSRRRDPILRKQPESFFQGLESMEEGEVKSASSDGLTTSLFLSYTDRRSIKHNAVDSTNDGTSCVPLIDCEANDVHLACSLMLYRKGALLGSNGLARLKCSLGTPSLKSVEDVITNTSSSSPCGIDWHFNFRAGYHRDKIPLALENGEYLLNMQERSNLLRQMPWMKNSAKEFGHNYYCLWMSERAGAEDIELDCSVIPALISDRVMLVTDCGATHLLAHGSIISQNSAKLAAAVRFAKMSRERMGNSNDDEILEIDLGSTSSKSCLLLLQHLYHGSIVCGLSRSGTECCQELLDLLFTAQEFLSPSLAQECEMRLLSANPYHCFCWSCCRATTALATSRSNTGYQIGADDCIYIVEGPSRLIIAETVLDVLAVSQSFGDSCLSVSDDSSYALEFAVVLHGGSQLSRLSSNRPSEGTSSEWTRMTSEKPLGGLREVAIDLLLTSFSDVLQSSAYAAQVEKSLNEMEDNEADQRQYEDDAPVLLLHMCLEELALSPTKEAFSVHSQSLKHVWAMSSCSK